MPHSRTVSAWHETWPLSRPFRISRGSKTEANVIVVEIEQDDLKGRGEAVPYARYGQTVGSALEDVASLAGAVEGGAGRHELGTLDANSPSARNAVDCALWDLEAKMTGVPVWQLAALNEPGCLVTAYTIGIGTPEAMLKAAADNRNRQLLKVKLDGNLVIERLRAVREGAPEARLVVDANEAWTMKLLIAIADELAELGVEMIEQPLPARHDGPLADYECPVMLCADESCHKNAGIDELARRYGMVNVKLDKTGGFTEAMALRQAARDAGLRFMVGCMVSTSLAMAPASLVAQGADIVDLDGPLMLRYDRNPGIRYEGSVMHPPPAQLWG